MSLDNLLKIASKFEKRIKLAQEDIQQGENDLVSIIDKLFSQKDKNAIASEIVNNDNMPDVSSLNISLKGNGSAITISAIVNNTENQVAKNIVSKYISAKKIPNNTKGSYNGWIKYPK